MCSNRLAAMYTRSHRSSKATSKRYFSLPGCQEGYAPRNVYPSWRKRRVEVLHIQKALNLPACADETMAQRSVVGLYVRTGEFSVFSLERKLHSLYSLQHPT